MRSMLFVLALSGALAQAQVPPPGQAAAADDPIKTIIGRLELEKYKATIKGLTQFGDRRQGTARNRAALDWIETQLKSYGCAPERITYTYTPRARGTGTPGAGAGAGARASAAPPAAAAARPTRRRDRAAAGSAA